MGECLPKSLCQWVKVNIFDRHLQGGVPVVTAAPLGLTHIDPVGGLITNTPEALPFQKGFQEIKGVVVPGHPVGANPPGDLAQDVAGEMENPDPGQNQKAHVVGQKLEVGFTGSSIPANKIIPGSTLPSCRTKEQTGQKIVFAVKNQVFHVLSHDATPPQVVIPGKQALEQLQLASAFNYLAIHRGHGLETAGDNRGLVGNIRNGPPENSLHAGLLGRGQDKITALL